jgi:hypothetical protein
MLLGSTNTGLVTIVLYGRETKSLVLRINLKTQEIAKVCEINTEKTEIIAIHMHKELTFGLVKQGCQQEVRVWSEYMQVRGIASVALEGANRVYAVEGELWLLSSLINSWSALYQLTKSGFKRSTAVSFLESQPTLSLFSMNKSYYQVCPSALHICGLRGSNKQISFPFQIDAAAGVLTSTGDFQVLISTKDRLYRGNDGKFVAETTSPIQALEVAGNRLFVLGVDQKLEVLSEKQGWWEWERTWQAWGAVGLLALGEQLLIQCVNSIEVRNQDFTLQTSMQIPPCRIRKLAGTSLLLLSDASSALLELSTSSILPFEDAYADVAISGSIIVVVDKAGMRAGEMKKEIKETVIPGELAGLSEDTLAVLAHSKIHLFPLPLTSNLSLSIPILTQDSITSLVATSNEILLVLNSLTLQLHSLSPNSSLLAQLSCPSPILSVSSLSEGWLLCTSHEVWFLTSGLEEAGPRIHFETEIYQKLRMAQDQECVQQFLDLSLVEKYESVKGARLVHPSGLPEKADAIKVVITLTATSVYISSWTHSTVTTKTQIVSDMDRN